MSHPLYWIALQTALGIPTKKIPVLMDFFGDAEGVFEATEKELCRCPTLTEKEITAILKKPYKQARAIWDECAATGISVITPEDVLYPNGLRNIPDMPCVLYVKGKVPRFDRIPAISIVGTRKPTVYGEIVCKRIASVLAVAGVTVVSGGALGIDGIAHTAALDAGGETVAVLGCGINNGYLRANKELRETIVRKGALISEYPPCTPATRYTFPARNRIIAALSIGTVVVEAGEKSGSLITADYALEQGKDVFALPGSVMSPTFEGSNHIIAEGATPIFSGLDILQHYKDEYFGVLQMNKAEELHREYLNKMVTVIEPLANHDEPQPKSEKDRPLPKNMPCSAGKDLSDTAKLLYNTLLDTEGLVLHEIMEQTGMQTAVLLRELTKLELDGCITKDPVGKYKIVMK